MLNYLYAILQRDLRVAWQDRGDLAVGLVFFVVVASLFPLAVGPESALLARIGPGVLWVAALLANLLALPRLFEADWRDGTLEQLLLTPQPVAVMVLGKILAHWLSTGLPLALISPILALQYFQQAETLPVLLASLLAGTLALSALGAVGAALTLGLRQGGVLLALIVLPLTTPVLIFGAGAASSAAAGLGGLAELWLLAAMLTLALFFSPWLTALALKLAVE